MRGQIDRIGEIVGVVECSIVAATLAEERSALAARYPWNVLLQVAHDRVLPVLRLLVAAGNCEGEWLINHHAGPVRGS